MVSFAYNFQDNWWEHLGIEEDNIGFPGQFRNFVDQIHFMSIQFRRFGSCITHLSFDFIFQAFDLALTPIKSKFVSFKFAKNAASLQNIQFSEEW